ncbi:MAG: MFS transporter [Deltaproteobacteria bacterium]|nr:MFS transporter [Deltaproteobacteria bacterium]
MVAVASLGSLVSSLTASVVGVILPKIGAWAHMGIMDVQWVSLVPMVVISAVLLPAGRLSDIIGHKRVYLGGVAFVGVGSLGCAVAPEFWTLLLARALSGVGAAMTMATAPALVSLAASPGHRGRALGMVSTAIYVGLAFGPPLGGLLESLGDFRTVFWFQVPVSVLLYLFTWKLMPETPVRPGRKRIDHAGAFFLTLAITGLLLALSRTESWPRWAILASTVVGILGLVAFVAVEKRTAVPMLDLSLFGDWTFTSATVGALLNYVAVFHVVFLMPFYLDDILGMASREAGLYLMAMPIVMSLVAGPSGYLSDRVGSRMPSFVGMAVMAAGMVWLTHQGAVLESLGLLAATCVVGLGTGIFISPNTNTLMSAAPRASQGSAAGVMALARSVGMMAGTALSAAVYGTVMEGTMASGVPFETAGAEGLRVAWWVGALVAVAASLVVLVRPRASSRGHDSGV